MTDFDKIALPALIPITGFLLWIVFVTHKGFLKTKKEALTVLIGCLVWPLTLLFMALISFYEYWSELPDE